MTAAVEQPSQIPTRSPRDGRGSVGRDQHGDDRPGAVAGEPRRGEVMVGAELALLAVTLATTLGVGRLFIDNSALPRLGAIAITSHVVAALLRRARVPVVLSAAISLVVLAVGIGWLYHFDTTWLGLPTADTRFAVRADLSTAWRAYTEVRAPAPVLPGFVVAAAIASWVSAWIADTAAFRMWAAVEAMIPSAAVFLFTSMQGADRQRTVATATYATAVLLFVLLHRTVRNDSGASWLAASPREGRWSLVRVGVALAITGILGGLVLGPAVPGAGDGALIAWRQIGDGGTGAGTRVTVSPFVTIRSRLVEQSDIEVFTVQTPTPDYWRLTALDEFDGDVWKSSGVYEKAKGTLPTSLPQGTSTATLRQTFDIEALTTLWLPAAYEPSSISAEDGIDPIYDPTSGTLTVKDGKDDADGLTYTVESRVPQRDLAALQSDTTPVPSDILQKYTQLPASLSSLARNTARQQTAGATTTYQKARALQDYFRTDYTYSLDVSAGHKVTDIDSFLRAKRGYCEQFAGTFAAMMRSLGIPARVAVGFTPGELRSDGLYHVLGRNAHAWPEVYFTGIGWVRFEPTPGRGAPGDQSYTGVSPAQSAADPDTSAAVTTTAVPTTTVAPAGSTGPNAADAAGANIVTDGGALPGSGAGEQSSGWGGLLRTLAVVVLVAAVALLAMPFVRFVRRHRRRRHAVEPRQRIDVAWIEMVETLSLLDIPVGAADTPFEVADRVAPALVGVGAREELVALADLTTRARYAPQPVEAGDATEAQRLRADLDAAVHGQISWSTRWRRALDPRR
jgi:transglutaminase-like putative cysteine protease